MTEKSRCQTACVLFDEEEVWFAAWAIHDGDAGQWDLVVLQGTNRDRLAPVYVDTEYPDSDSALSVGREWIEHHCEREQKAKDAKAKEATLG